MSGNHDRDRRGPAGEDAAVTRAWRQASDETPPARLDAEILAAAHQSVHDEAGAKTVPVTPRARSRLMQWQPLAAAAAVACLAFMLVQTLPREPEMAPPASIEAQIPAPTPDAALETRSRAPAPAVTEAPVLPVIGQAVRDRGAENAGRSPARETTADVADAMRDPPVDERKGVTTEASGDAYSAEAVAPATERTATRASSLAAPPDAADWATRIEALHGSGDLAGAAEALREFRAVDPVADSHLPESLRDWARTVE